MAFFRVCDRVVERHFGPADISAAQFQSTKIQDIERDNVAFADLAQNIFLRHKTILEHDGCRRASVQTEFLLFVAGHQPRSPLDDEGGEFVPVHFGEDDEDIGEAAVRDPHLLPFENISAAVFCKRGLRFRCQSIRARSGFGQAIGGDPLTCGQFRQIFFPLFRCPEVDDRQRSDRRVSSKAGAEGRHDRDLFSDKCRTHLVESKPAVVFGDVDPQQIKLTCLDQQLASQGPVLGVNLFCSRQHLLAHKLIRDRGEHPLFLADILAGEDLLRTSIFIDETGTRDNG